jgi:eukaryotic-like serine/threonine-protein kinase
MSQAGFNLPRVLAGRYELSEPLASGQVTSVWRGHDRVLGRDVIVKLLRPDLAAQPGVRERFRLAAVNAARLTHPNIVALYDTGEQQGIDYQVMELVEGSTLGEVLRGSSPLPAAEAAQVAFLVAEALGYAHQAGVVHGNLTPNNILLGIDGTVKVGDFSIAAATGADDDPSRTGELAGSPAYVAPEIIDGQEPDGRADLYSLGACLYEMLTGRPPQPGLSMPGYDPSVLIAPRAVRADVPRELDTAVQRAMAPDPADRYPNAQAMAAALARSAAQADGGPGSLMPATLESLQLAEVTPEPGFLRHEGRWLGWTLALVGLAAVVAVAGVTLSRGINLDLRRPGTGTHTPSIPPASTAGTATTPVRFTQALAFDPLGDGHENDDQAARAIDQDPTSAWSTQHYNRPALGGLKPGVGLVLDAGNPVAAGELDLTLVSGGGSLEVYGAAGDAHPPGFPDEWTRLATVPDLTSRQQRIAFTGEGSFRWYLVWFTSLPPAPDDPSRYQNGIAEAVLGPSS